LWFCSPNDFEEVRVFMERRKAEMADMDEQADTHAEPKARTPELVLTTPVAHVVDTERAAIAPPPQLMTTSQPMHVDPPQLSRSM
jgi:hypothetical protein